MSLGQRVKEFREEHGLTQDDFAILAGISNGSVSNLETGRHRPRVELAAKVISAMEVADDTRVQPSRRIEVANLRPTMLRAALEATLDNAESLPSEVRAFGESVLKLDAVASA